MYHFTSPIPNTENFIVRPVIYSIIKQLMCEGMLPRIKRVVFTDAIEHSKLAGTVLCNKAARMKCAEFISIQAERKYRTTDDQWGRSWRRHNMPIWLDKDHDLSITPMYDEITITMTIQVVSPSLSKLRQWLDGVRVKQRLGRQRVNHPVEYAMPFPRNAYRWFCDMYGLTNDHVTVNDMIRKHASNALDIVSSGTHYELVTSEYQANAKGTMIGTEPNIQTLENGRYTGTMIYTIEYNKATAMLFEYPIMVDQHTIPFKYVPKPPCIPNRYWIESPMDKLDIVPKQKYKLNVPNFDRVQLSKYPSFYEPILTVLVTIDKDCWWDLFNLENLGGVDISEHTLDVIRRFYIEEITQYKRSPYMLTIHENDSLLHPNTLTLKDNLDVHLARRLNLDGIYRVSLCVLVNTTAIPEHVYMGLVSNEAALKEYVDAVNSIDTSYVKFNPRVIPSDFSSGVYLRNFSPLVRVRSVPIHRHGVYRYPAGGLTREQIIALKEQTPAERRLTGIYRDDDDILLDLSEEEIDTLLIYNADGSISRAVNNIDVLKMSDDDKSKVIYWDGNNVSDFTEDEMILLENLKLEAEWDYTPESVWVRGTAGGHTRTKTVETYSTKVGPSVNPKERVRTAQKPVEDSNLIARPSQEEDL